MDPIADFLTRIRNGLAAKYKEVTVPYSRMKFDLCRVLMEEGFISNFRADGEGARQRIVVALKYTEDGQPVIQGIELVSRQSRRVYVEATGVPRVLGGLGAAILSTSKGLMTDRDARRRHIGGEVVCRVW
uniref:Small ribosomal subunit protein uS8 n=1 Tax=candidate division WOR-3 bacterium TaxID=2052148 RepID=A0A7C4CBZ3_UNCW3